MDYASYMALEPDLSGSVSKNRFCAEVCWGVAKLLELLAENKGDFAVVFDCQCDVEVHLPDSYEFYQVKTSSDTQKFGVGWLCKPGKNGSLSIAARLYRLREALGIGSVIFRGGEQAVSR